MQTTLTRPFSLVQCLIFTAPSRPAGPLPSGGSRSALTLIAAAVLPVLATAVGWVGSRGPRLRRRGRRLRRVGPRRRGVGNPRRVVPLRRAAPRGLARHLRVARRPGAASPITLLVASHPLHERVDPLRRIVEPAEAAVDQIERSGPISTQYCARRTTSPGSPQARLRQRGLIGTPACSRSSRRADGP